MNDKTLVERQMVAGDIHAGTYADLNRQIEAQATRIETLEAALREMSPSIEWLEQHEYNPFEPDNQGPAFAEVMKLSAIHAKALESQP